ncbi:NAD(P)-binding protein [Lichtheimia hyalospora FSU 10163]|nr:NAD(P)-binding protein [Lichtheimia hyalospora FSU 10163]
MSISVEKQQTVAIVTGANTGVGYGIVQRLLEKDCSIKIVMACRNLSRARHAQWSLLERFPTADIDIELVDLNNVPSLSTYGINWGDVFWLFLKDPVGLMERSDATIQVRGEINQDGMGSMFAANVFGHYVIARELENELDASGDGRIMWTSSLTAEKRLFNIDDWQGVKSVLPYESSKWACDLVAIGSNERYKEQGSKIISYSTAPGVVASTIGNLPSWIRRFRFCGVTSQNITGYRGAVATVFVALQPHLIDYFVRYTSATTAWGRSFVTSAPIEGYDKREASKLLQHCEMAYQAWKRKLDQEN